MATRTIEFSLSSFDISHAVTEIERYKEDFLRTCNELISLLVADGIITGKYAIAAMGALDTGELHDGMKGYFNMQTRTGIVYNDVYYAVFVEYGTGVVGEKNDYKGEFMPASVIAKGKTYSSYDQNGHGEAGWWYKNDHDGHVYWTKGQPSRPFFYTMYQSLKRQAPRTAAAVFRGLY